MRHSVLFLLFILLYASCSTPEARRPITQKTSTVISETLAQNKKLIAFENKMIERFIKKDSLQTYFASNSGFWYAYQNKIQEDNQTPTLGDSVEFIYNIEDLNGGAIYTKESLGIKKYKIDREDFIPALQEGIKLMKIGETITFVIPSYRAFGLVGDGNKIGVNQAIKSTVTLLNINQKNK